MSTVDIVSEEKVVNSFELSRDAVVSSHLIDIEEAQQVYVLAMDVAKYLERRFKILDNHGLNLKNIDNFVCQFNDVLPLAWEPDLGAISRMFFGLEQGLQEHRAESLVGVFVG